MLSLRVRRYIAWLALFAMCLVALAPSISKWLAADQGVLWVEVCGPSGLERIALSADPGDGAPQAPTLGDIHCGYCVLAHHLPFVPPHIASLMQYAAVLLLAHLFGRTQPPLTRLIRRAHPPRAPPAFL